MLPALIRKFHTAKVTGAPSVEVWGTGSPMREFLHVDDLADAYPRYAPTMEWDTAAGHAIVNEAGKQLIDVSTGAPMRYNKHELVNQWFIVQ